MIEKTVEAAERRTAPLRTEILLRAGVGDPGAFEAGALDVAGPRPMLVPPRLPGLPALPTLPGLPTLPARVRGAAR